MPVRLLEDSFPLASLSPMHQAASNFHFTPFHMSFGQSVEVYSVFRSEICVCTPRAQDPHGISMRALIDAARFWHNAGLAEGVWRIHDHLLTEAGHS